MANRGPEWLRPRSIRDETFGFGSSGWRLSPTPGPLPRMFRAAGPVPRFVPFANIGIESLNSQANDATVEIRAVDGSSNLRPAIPGMIGDASAPFVGFQIKSSSGVVSEGGGNFDADRRVPLSTPETRHLTLRDWRQPKPSNEPETGPPGKPKAMNASGDGLERPTGRHTLSGLVTARNSPMRRDGRDSVQNVLAGDQLNSSNSSLGRDGQVTKQHGGFPGSHQVCREGAAETHEGGMQ